MYGDGKSDRLIVAVKRSNKDDGVPWLAENVEPSGLTKGNSFQQNQVPDTVPGGFDMANSKRARSEKSRTQPRDRSPTSRRHRLATCAGTDTAVCSGIGSTFPYLAQRLRVTT